MKGWHSRTILYAALGLALIATACTAPRFDGGTAEGKAAILDAVYSALANKDCSTAIVTIDGLYDSAYTDNEVRLARASAFACAAGMTDMADALTNLAKNGASLAGPQFWQVMTKLYYDPSGAVLDKRVTAGGYSVDAMFAAIAPGSVVASAHRVNEAPNIGTVFADDRIGDSNLLLVFVSMAMVGEYQSRYGAPDPTTFKKGQNLGATASNTLGWMKWDKVDDNACAYASSVLNMLDAIDITSAKLGNIGGQNLNVISQKFGTAIDDACDAACKGVAVDGVDYGPGNPDGGVGCGAAKPNGFDLSGDSGCKGSSNRPCQILLRNRALCTTSIPTLDSTRAQCAAAGIARFVSTHPLLGWQ